MHARTRHALRGIAASCLISAAASAQTTKPTPSTAATEDERFARLERRLDEMDRHYQSELKARDEEIGRLKAQLDKTLTPLPVAQTPAAATGPDAPSPAEGPTTARVGTTALPTQDEIEKTKQDILKDIESRENPPPTQRTPASFNPDIAVVTNAVGNVSTDNTNIANNRFDVGSVELDLRAAVDPRADAVAILPISRDVDNPLFFQSGVTEQPPGPETGIEVEEAYLFLHDFGVPNLTAKAGRFHLRFGRWNLLHAHDWPTADNNFVNQSFLAPEALTESGLSLSYVIPPKLVADQYIEAVLEVTNGEGGDSPTLNNDAFVDSPAVNTHLLWNHDITKDWNVEWGGSFLYGKHDNSGDLDVFLYGTDLTLIHTDPTGRFNNQLLMAEFIYGDTDTSPTETQHSYGAYVLAQQQLHKDWYLGVRLDWTKNALDQGQDVWGVSPYVSWYWSEFLRFRMEYQHKDGDVTPEDILYFQLTWIFGAHPPHPYWAMR